MGLIGDAFARLGGAVLSVVAPRCCVVCGRLLLQSEDVLCVECLAGMPHTRDAAGLDERLRLIADNGVAPAGFCAAWFDYDPAHESAELIRKAKYGGRPRQARRLGRLFGELLATGDGVGDSGAARQSEEPIDFDDIIVEENVARMPQTVARRLADVDVLLPVPLHWTRRIKRGYNQSEEIARGLSEVCGAVVADNLVAIRGHASQTHKGAFARRRNIAGCMGVVHPSELDGLDIAIVDDIVTTGSTMAEAVQAISRSGARPASLGIIALGVTSR